jgi:hypothetical protein
MENTVKGFLAASFDLKTVYTSRRGLLGQLLFVFSSSFMKSTPING